MWKPRCTDLHFLPWFSPYDNHLLTSVCWMAWEAVLAVLWLSLASSTFSLISGRSCFSSSISTFSSAAPSAPSAAAITSCNMASHQQSLISTSHSAGDALHTMHQSLCCSSEGETYPDGSRWPLWSCCSAGWPGCTDPCSTVWWQRDSGSLPADDCGEEGASAAGKDTPGSLPVPGDSYLENRTCGTQYHFQRLFGTKCHASSE